MKYENSDTMNKHSYEDKGYKKTAAAVEAKQAAKMSKVAQGKSNPSKKANKTLKKSY